MGLLRLLATLSLLFRINTVSSQQQCRTPNPLLQSQSCNEGSKEVLPSSQCCPKCCQNSSGFCEVECDFLNNCVGANSPTKIWSGAYTSYERKSIMLVLQRPQKWDVPEACMCGSTHDVNQNPIGKFVALSEEPLFKKGPVSSPFEENLSHVRAKDKNIHGCCTPPKGYDWYTRNYRCIFTKPCMEDTISLVKNQQLVETIQIEVIEKIGSEKDSNENLICIPRYSRDFAKRQLQNNHLVNWLHHHLIMDFGRVLLYADDCLAETLSPSVMDALEHKLTFLDGSGVNKGDGRLIQVVDISSVREIPAWYHNQMLSMKDCWARGVAGEAQWIASIDIDEFLTLPKGWSKSSFFSSRHSFTNDDSSGVRLLAALLGQPLPGGSDPTQQYNPSIDINYNSLSSSSNDMKMLQESNHKETTLVVNSFEEFLYDVYKPSISLGSLNVCSKVDINDKTKCEGIWKGHRKYLIRASPSKSLVQSMVAFLSSMNNDDSKHQLRGSILTKEGLGDQTTVPLEVTDLHKIIAGWISENEEDDYSVLLENNIMNKLLRPPLYIHGDPGEYRLSVDSGMFIMHFSRCEVENIDNLLEFEKWLSIKMVSKDIGMNEVAVVLDDLNKPRSSHERTASFSSAKDLNPCLFDKWKYN